MQTDITKLSLVELKALQASAAKAIADQEAARKREAIAALTEKAKSMGYSLAQLTGKPAGKKSVSAPKYANPSDPTDTWTGKGRRPAWFVAELAAGRDPADMMIGG